MPPRLRRDLPPHRFHAGAALLLAGLPLAAEPSATPPPPEPPAPAAGAPLITTRKDELGDLLRAWHAAGTAAGHIGDRYDNRDRGHSELDRRPWPQLGKIEYTAEQKEKRQDWAFCGGLHAGVVFGNSSTSAPARLGGSNARMAYVNPRGLAALLAQYTRNHLYVYPEHQDHDPGHDGHPDGWGDLFPTNTPFVIISQGSSGSDQPFLRAIAATLAAFRPETKQRLVKTGLLMPAVQMIFRSCNRHLQNPAEYRTGKAHPTAFEGGWVDERAMAERAHGIAPDALPPVAMLRVLQEDAPVNGVDFFAPGATERHFDSPFVVARVFRGRHAVHRMTVSAEESFDLDKRPLTFHWAVLRGDAARIRIDRQNAAGSAVAIEVPWHDRRPVFDRSPLASNRVDIGCFVNNGVHDSPPSFVTLCFLDHEARTYDAEGRLLEIGYQAGGTRLEAADWGRLLGLFEEGAGAFPGRLLRSRFTPEERAALRAAAQAKAPLDAAVAAAEARKQAADAARKQAETAETASESTAARKALDDARKALRDFLAAKREGLPAPIETLVLERALGGLMRDPAFFVSRQADLEAFLAAPEGAGRRGALETGLRRTAALGILARTDAGRFALSLLRNAPTRYEQAMLERLHGEILADVLFPGAVKTAFRVHYVPPELAEPPAWRDVYRHDAAGRDLGWTRYYLNGDPPADFTPDGLLVLALDARGRPTRAQTVRYRLEEPKGNVAPPHWRPLLQIPGDEVRHIAYDGEDNSPGRVTRTERP